MNIQLIQFNLVNIYRNILFLKDVPHGCKWEIIVDSGVTFKIKHSCKSQGEFHARIKTCGSWCTLTKSRQGLNDV